MNEIDEIRQQMAQIRHDLHQDVAGVVTGVEEVMDWRSALRGHPWITVGVALAAGYLVGYLVTPRRQRPATVALDHVAPAPAPAPAAAPAQRPRKPLSRIASWAFHLLGPIATQALQGYALVWIENRLKEHLHQMPTVPPGATQAGGPGDPGAGDDYIFRVRPNIR